MSTYKVSVVALHVTTVVSRDSNNVAC